MLMSGPDDLRPKAASDGEQPADRAAPPSLPPASMPPEELRAAMHSLGYRTQSDLASAIGVSRSAVSLWLEGKVGVPRPVAMLLRMLIAARRRPY